MSALLVYDGDCGFCKFWVKQAQKLTDDSVEYKAYQSLSLPYQGLSHDEFSESIYYFSAEKKYSAAHAAFKLISKKYPFLLWLYEVLTPFSFMSEALYKLVAKNRMFFSALTQFFVKTHEEGTSSYLLKAISFIYIISFASLLSQAQGLWGADGILPIANYLQSLANSFDGSIVKLYSLFPSVYWLNSSDAFITGSLVFALLSSTLALFSIFPILNFVISYVIYFSLVLVGGSFMSFQWDILLLETSFLVLIWNVLRCFFRNSNFINSLMLLLVNFLVFKLMFMSGLVKISSGDPNWASFSALKYHYETQPLPNPVSFLMQQLPAWLQQLSTVLMFFIELILPFFIFFNMRLRRFAALLLIMLQLVILLTGNYGFFNLLAIILCLTLYDDSVHKFLAEKLHMRALRLSALSSALIIKISIFIMVSIFIWINSVIILRSFPVARFRQLSLPSSLLDLHTNLIRYKIASSYGLFAVMTTKRYEIIIQGCSENCEDQSPSSENWKTYEFHYKPGDINQLPVQVAPHQPRLDWQMWFAALSRYDSPRNRWFVSFMEKLLKGSKPVTRLLKADPFKGSAPKKIRALFYEYHFKDIFKPRNNQRLNPHSKYYEIGDIWTRELKSYYMPIIGLKEPSGEA